MVASGGWEADLLLAAQMPGAVRYHGFHPQHRHACCDGRNIFGSAAIYFLPRVMMVARRQMRGSRRLLGESEDTWSLEGASSATSGWRLYSVPDQESGM